MPRLWLLLCQIDINQAHAAPIQNMKPICIQFFDMLIYVQRQI